MDWFRMYADILDDPRLQRLPGETVKTWLNLLSVASQHEPRWTLPPVDIIAFKLRSSPSRTQKAIAELLAAGLLDLADGIYTFTEWSSRQASSDDAAARQRTHRLGQQGDTSRAPSRDDNVTSPVTVTSPEREREEQNRSRRPKRDLEEAAAAAEREIDTILAAAAAPGATSIIGPDGAPVQGEIVGALYQLAKDTLGAGFTHLLKQCFLNALEAHPSTDISFALEEAQNHNKLSWAYVQAILDRKMQEHSGDAYVQEIRRTKNHR